jgi:hypothetical protein
LHIGIISIGGRTEIPGRGGRLGRNICLRGHYHWRCWRHIRIGIWIGTWIIWIWEAKTRRQIIFTSHNANLVVNGDAELVVCCDYRIAGDYSRGRISHEGAIDITEIRDTIKIVMEGGEKAFKLRLDKYGF